LRTLGIAEQTFYHWRRELQDERLKREIFYTLKEAQFLIQRWRQEYKTIRPHSALGYRSPAPAGIRLIPRELGYSKLRQDLWIELNPTLT
jgi:transposase InsO family protein